MADKQHGPREQRDQKEPTRALDKASRVIEALAAESGLAPADIADACDIPRSSVYRVLDGLVDVGWATADDDGNYTLSLDWLRLADAARASRTEWDGVLPVMRSITARTGMTSFLTVASGDETVCVECAQGHAIDSVILRPGRVLPLHAGAAGRVTLAYFDDDAIERYLARAPFPAYNENTLVTVEQLRDDIAETRSHGYALSDEDVTLGIGAVGVPILDPADGHVIAALSAGGFVDEVLAMQESFAELLREGVKAIQDAQHH
ncbi:IclR family transcriptional regulator [Bifidobacterium sp. UTBIF-78]|uniref:IclR family transcriptional regulator n=1 Tax=Bifidobacterium sp. UTBIF-78 TaxID=1465263 RepID=UPI00112C26C4|nr:IclR family transcriptional regulator [Bifidobacterium sp. UTBIF-78]